jgi:ZIP family zinc transporter
MDERTWIALLLCTLAGLATVVGSAIAFFAKHTHTGVLSAGLGLSAGVMVYVSLVELLPSAREELVSDLGAEAGGWTAIALLLGGMLVTAVLDRLVPAWENPHVAALVEEREHPPRDARLARVGILTALAIALHNVPEGIATFFTALADPPRGIAIAVAIALHNIPEGLAVAIPVFWATGSRAKAFSIAAISGLAEPAGALVAWGILGGSISPTTLGGFSAAVAGIMVFLSLDQLIPNAKRYDEGHAAVYGLLSGTAIMAVTLEWLS